VKPNDELEILDLLDNGVNADTTQDDGVYSKYFAYPNQPGRYTVKCQVNSTNHKSFEQLGFIGSASPQLFGNSFISCVSFIQLKKSGAIYCSIILQVMRRSLKRWKEFQWQISPESFPVAHFRLFDFLIANSSGNVNFIID
jgi:hypothetical protein